MPIPSSSSAWQARQTLGARLGELREDAGLTGRALARLCGWHESKVSRIEHAKTAPSAEDIRAWCEHCGAIDQVDDLVAFLRTVEGMFVEWPRIDRTGQRHAQESVLPTVQRTRLFRVYSSWLIPGALQTPDYARAVLQAIAKRRDLPDDVDEAVAARGDWLRVLHERDRRIHVLIEEPVLRTVIGGAQVMAGQLGHLITIAALPSMSLGIIPMGLDRDAEWPVEDFWLLDDEQVSVELVSGWLTITQPREIAMYAQAFGRLSDLAVSGVQARRLITAAIDALQ
jgi:hypothetical protein